MAGIVQLNQLLLPTSKTIILHLEKIGWAIPSMPHGTSIHETILSNGHYFLL